MSPKILMQSTSVRRFLALTAVSVLVGACNSDPNTTKLQYVPDMADSSTVKPQRDFLAPPPGSVTMNAILYPATSAESEKVLTNPFPVNEQTETKGKELFNSFCVPCHGDDGKGKGPITDVFPQPPDITTQVYAERGDGFFFHTITFGAILMPSQGHSIPAHERWKIVHYVRVLQRQSAGK